MLENLYRSSFLAQAVRAGCSCRLFVRAVRAISTLSLHPFPEASEEDTPRRFSSMTKPLARREIAF